MQQISEKLKSNKTAPSENDQKLRTKIISCILAKV